MKRLTIIIYLIIFQSFLCVYPQGLQFHGNEKTIADRSSLSIPGEDEKPKVVSEYGVDLEVRNHNLNSPGIILYLRDTTGDEAFSLIFNYDFGENKAVFTFAKNGEKTLFSTSFTKEKVLEKYMPVSIRINTVSGVIDISIGSHKSTIRMPELKGIQFSPQLYFGMSRNIVECASFSIRNLRITADNSTTDIPLSECDGENVHDSPKKVIGKVKNPKWLINRSFSWNPILKVHSSTPTGFAFDKTRQKFHSYNADSIKTYDILSKELSILPLKGDSLPTKLGMNLIDAESGTIIPYEIYHNAFFAKINPETGEWKTLNVSEPKAVWHHHAHAYRKKDNSLILFGGYGNRTYSDKLVRFNFNNNIWDTIPLSGDKIPPRFFTSMMMTESEDSIYLYGGKGNLEGKQDLGTIYYYDLYLIDLNSKKVKKLWEQPAPENDRVPARTLLPDPDRKHFYAMMYPEYQPHSSLQLFRININDGSATAVGDSIPIISEEIATNVALYDNPAFEQIYCVVQEFEKYGQSTTSVFSISAPPVSASQLLALSENANDNKNKLWIYIAAASLIVIAIGIILIMRKRKRTDIVNKKDCDNADKKDRDFTDTPIPDSITTEPVLQKVTDNSAQTIESNDSPEIPSESQSEVQEMNSISLFGPFSVKDTSGRDITYMFSRKLKLLFLYILLCTISKNGVTSSDLSSIFWSDKEPDKVKNLRNVTLNKLRKVLAEMNGVNLVYEQGLFRIDLSGDCYCDISRLYNISSSLHNLNPGKDQCAEINSIFVKGKFMVDTEDPIFDYFHQKIDSYIIDYLSERIEYSFRRGKYVTTRRLCNSLLKTDPLSELALTYAIKSCRVTGRNDKALTIYNNFIKEYRKMMGEDYPKSIEELESTNGY